MSELEPVHESPSDNELLSVQGISVWRGENLLLNDLSFTLEAGQVLQVRGANGSGKTTLLRILCGIGLADDGDIKWRGESIDRRRDQFHEELLYLGHKAGIKGALSALENLRIFCTLAGDEQPRADDAALLGVLDNLALLPVAELPCRHLSAGQQRRVSLARLVLQAATLWVLDEPLTSLDKAGLAWVESRISEHVAKGGSVILTTHAPLHIDGVEVHALELN